MPQIKQSAREIHLHAVMETFRIYWLDARGAVSGIEDVKALCDDDAIERAATLCEVAGYVGFEAWKGITRVGTRRPNDFKHLN